MWLRAVAVAEDARRAEPPAGVQTDGLREPAARLGLLETVASIPPSFVFIRLSHLFVFRASLVIVRVLLPQASIKLVKLRQVGLRVFLQPIYLALYALIRTANEGLVGRLCCIGLPQLHIGLSLARGEVHPIHPRQAPLQLDVLALHQRVVSLPPYLR